MWKRFRTGLLAGWCIAALTLVGVAIAQPYELVLARGHVIDPANRIDQVMDVAIAGGRIAKVDESIGKDQAKHWVDVAGLYVTPGLVDLHAHVFGNAGRLFPDDTALVTGTTTVVDAGGAGWRTFDEFKNTIIAKSQTRVLAFLNVTGKGMVGEAAEDDVSDMDPQAIAAKIKQYPELLVGIKSAHFRPPGWASIDRAVEAGRLSNTPVIVDSHIFTRSGRSTRDKLLDHLRPGDIHTHAYNDRQLELVDRFTGRVQDYARLARERGLVFDLGHGGGSFLWPVAVRAMKDGFPPDTISTDLHAISIMIPQSDMPNCISKLMTLGMTLQDAIARSTANPARAIKRFPELGTLGEGREADVAVFALRSGVFAYKDAWGHKMLGQKKLECVLTVRAGRIVYDQDGLSRPLWTESGNYGVIE
jgi:dihydroorotase